MAAPSMGGHTVCLAVIRTSSLVGPIPPVGAAVRLRAPNPPSAGRCQRGGRCAMPIGARHRRFAHATDRNHAADVIAFVTGFIRIWATGFYG